MKISRNVFSTYLSIYLHTQHENLQEHIFNIFKYLPTYASLRLDQIRLKTEKKLGRVPTIDHWLRIWGCTGLPVRLDQPTYALFTYVRSVKIYRNVFSTYLNIYLRRHHLGQIRLGQRQRKSQVYGQARLDYVRLG